MSSISPKPWFAAALAAAVFVGAARPDSHARADASSQSGSRPEDALLGEWWTEGNEGRVKFIRMRDGTFRGITTCCKHPDSDRHPQTDRHNPKPELRGRSTLGIVLIWKLRYEGDGEYEGGYVYNPRDGNTYRFEIEIIDKDTIEIHGYLGISLFGQSQIWKRANGAVAAGPSAPVAKAKR